jgi:hypothetical protein
MSARRMTSGVFDSGQEDFMIEVNLTGAVLLSIIGALLSVVFTWFPGLNTWYAGLQKDAQSGVMLGLLVLAAAVVMALGCFNLIVVVGLVCTGPGILNMVINLAVGLIGAMVANQGTYGLTKNLAPKKVMRIKAEREIDYGWMAEG